MHCPNVIWYNAKVKFWDKPKGVGLIMKKLDINPFREFWQDCFNCIVYSLTEYSQDVPRLYYYNNMYVYKFTEEHVSENNGVYRSLVPWTDNFRLLDELTTNMEKYKLFAMDDPLTLIKSKLDENRIILVAIDLFDWIREGLHYHNNHIIHMSLVIGYDDDSRELIILETGDDMYAEHRVCYDDAIKAFAGANLHSRIYDINKSTKVEMFSKDDLAHYAKDIIKSIDQMISAADSIWNVDGFSTRCLDEVLTIIQTHMFSMQNRAFINAYMFENYFESAEIKGIDFSKSFHEMEKRFEQQKGVCIKSQYRNNKLENILGIKEKLFSMLAKEKNLWLHYISNYDAMQIKTCYDK